VHSQEVRTERLHPGTKVSAAPATAGGDAALSGLLDQASLREHDEPVAKVLLRADPTA
jgi:hypothetical protein